jgi:hypothetical protein
MTTPTNSPESHDYADAREQLREGIESSREILRQTRLLIALSQCDGPSTRDKDGFKPAS